MTKFEELLLCRIILHLSLRYIDSIIVTVDGKDVKVKVDEKKQKHHRNKIHQIRDKEQHYNPDPRSHMTADGLATKRTFEKSYEMLTFSSLAAVADAIYKIINFDTDVPWYMSIIICHKKNYYVGAARYYQNQLYICHHHDKNPIIFRIPNGPIQQNGTLEAIASGIGTIERGIGNIKRIRRRYNTIERDLEAITSSLEAIRRGYNTIKSANDSDTIELGYDVIKIVVDNDSDIIKSGLDTIYHAITGLNSYIKPIAASISSNLIPTGKDCLMFSDLEFPAERHGHLDSESLKQAKRQFKNGFLKIIQSYRKNNPDIRKESMHKVRLPCIKPTNYFSKSYEVVATPAEILNKLLREIIHWIKINQDKVYPNKRFTIFRNGTLYTRLIYFDKDNTLKISDRKFPIVPPPNNGDVIH